MDGLVVTFQGSDASAQAFQVIDPSGQAANILLDGCDLRVHRADAVLQRSIFLLKFLVGWIVEAAIQKPHDQDGDAYGNDQRKEAKAGNPSKHFAAADGALAIS